MKQISKETQTVIAELQVLLELDHPHVIRLYEWFEDSKSVYLVTELATGGDLSSRFPCEQPEAVRLFNQLMGAVRYCHDRGVVHRDLKAGNCLLTGKTEPIVKVIDFGLAAIRKPRDTPGRWLEQTVGTRSHMAPEVLDPRKSYGVRCDIWSAGIILHHLLVGKHPFPERCGSDHSCPTAMMEEAGIVPEAQELVLSMLQHSPDERPSAEEVQRHRWLAGQHGGEQDLDERRFQRILEWVRAWSKTFSGPWQLERALATAVAQQLPEDEIAGIRRSFKAIDLAGSGMLSKAAIGDAYRRCGFALDEDELSAIFAALNCNDSGLVAYTRWLSAALAPDVLASDRYVKAAFGFFDLNGSGLVSDVELQKFLGEAIAEDAMERWDSNGDRKLSLREFKQMMLRLAAEKAKSQATTSPTTPEALCQGLSMSPCSDGSPYPDGARSPSVSPCAPWEEARQ